MSEHVRKEGAEQRILSQKEVGFDVLLARIIDYEGKGFISESRDIRDLDMIEYLERLGADKGRYFGNIVHQGVRDHSGMSEHGGNEGEYEDELALIIADKRLKSRVRRDLESEKFLSVNRQRIIELMEGGKSVEEAIEEIIIYQYVQGRMQHQQESDVQALHFSSNAILDHCYGTELGNECFVLFPESWSLKDRVFWSRAVRTDASRDTQYNDVYLWPQNNETPSAIDLDGALMFVPRDNQVDKQTGSFYEVKDRQAVVDYEKVDQFVLKFKEISSIKEQLNRSLGVAGDPIGVLFEKGILEYTDGVWRLKKERCQSVLKADCCQQASQYLEMLTTLDIDPIKYDQILSSYMIREDLADDKQEIAKALGGFQNDKIRKFFNTILFNERHDDCVYDLCIFFGLEKAGEESVSEARVRLEQAGLDLDLLDKLVGDEELKTKVINFIQSHIGSYKIMTKGGKGVFFKKATDTVKSMDYYESLIAQQLRDINVTITKTDKYDIVEYKGKVDDGEVRVYRVVYYTGDDANKSIRDFYHSLKIEFDDRVIGDNEEYGYKEKERSFATVEYNYDLLMLREKLRLSVAV